MSSIFGLDIGSQSIKLVKIKGKEMVALTAPNPTGRLGVDLVPAEKAVLTDSLSKMISEAGVKNGKVVVAIPEPLIYSRIMEFPVMPQAELASAVKWESEQVVPLPSDQIELSWVVMEKPNRVTGSEKMKTMVVAVPKKVSSSYLFLMEELGLETLRMENELVSLSRSLVFYRKANGVNLVMDVGASATRLAIVTENQVVMNLNSSIAGLALTRLIAEAFKLNIATAEQYKLSYGVDKTEVEGKIYLTVEPMLSELIGEVKKIQNAYNSAYPKRAIDRLILTGGSAHLKGLTALLVEATGLEVVIADPVEGFKLSGAAVNQKNLLAVAAGLVLEE
ncbi:type IV pilus assembly protein PilM [Candidatus Collierbacteria bacterium]|nr:type IV pilus assembly protein PilM [Candidatus Collierbacteria bacterium]